jgi:hypothetical protein
MNVCFVVTSASFSSCHLRKKLAIGAGARDNIWLNS